MGPPGSGTTRLARAVPTAAPTFAALLLFVYFWHRQTTAAGAGALVVAIALAGLAIGWSLVDVESYLLVLVLPAFVFASTFAVVRGAKLALGDVLALAAVLGWAGRSAVRGDALFRTRHRSPLIAGCILFSAVNFASAAWSPAPRHSMVQALQVAELVVFLTVLFASVPLSLRRIRHGLLAYIAVSTAIAVPVALRFLGNAINRASHPAFLLGMNKNALGNLIAVGFVLAYALWLDREPFVPRWLLTGAGLALCAGLGATASRGALVGALVGVIVVSALLRRGRLLTIALAFAGAATFALSVQAAITQRLNLQLEHGGYSSVSIRFIAWRTAWHAFLSHPLLGTGTGTFVVRFPQFHAALSDPNNLFLQTAAELGAVGLAALGYLLYRLARALIDARDAPSDARRLAVAAGGGAVVCLVHFQFDVSWVRGATSTCFALVGVVIAALRIGSPEVTTPAALAPAIPFPEPQSSMRVLHLLTSTGYAGIERHVISLAEGLRARGVDAVVACRPGARQLREEAAKRDIPVIPRQGPGVSWLKDVFDATLALRPAIVHVHDGVAAVSGWQLSKVCRAKLVRTQHFTEPASVSRQGWRRDASLGAHRAINSEAAALVAVSESAAEGVRARREMSAERISVIAPGISLPTDAQVEAAAAARTGTRPIVACVGRLEREKRPATLLEAAPAVLRVVPDCRFVFVGDGSERERLEEHARQIGVEASVEWTGAVPDATLVIRTARVLVDPTPEEAFGLVLAEAMAWAVPVVACTTGGGGELVSDSGGGLTFTPDDPASLAVALLRVLRAPALADSLGAFGREYALRSLGIAACAGKMHALYERVARS